MGTLIFWGVIGSGVFLGIMLISLLNMAKRTDQIYDRRLRGEELATRSIPLHRPGLKTLPPTSSGEARPQRDLSPPVAAS